MAPEKYNISWNEFKDCSSDAFKTLRLDTDFLDVTLACTDGQQFKAHKVVLSSFSSVFQTILKGNPHSHPLIYLMDITKNDIENILDFLYLGEAKVAKSDVERFMAVAEKLKINGLVQHKDTSSICKEVEIYENTVEASQDKVDDQENAEKAFHDEETENESNSMNVYDVVSEIVKLEVNLGEKETFDNLKDIDEINEMAEVEKADEQEMKYSNKNKCNECDYTATHAGNLKIHVMAKHEGIRYNCDECDHVATQPGSLKVHVMAKHRGIRFLCDICEYKGTTKGNTNMHMKRKHSL